jgi:hypothetical protein
MSKLARTSRIACLRRCALLTGTRLESNLNDEAPKRRPVVSSVLRCLAAPPAREKAEREEGDDDDDDPQDSAEDAPPFDDTRSLPSIRSYSGAACKRRSAPKGATRVPNPCPNVPKRGDAGKPRSPTRVEQSMELSHFTAVRSLRCHLPANPVEVQVLSSASPDQSVSVPSQCPSRERSAHRPLLQSSAGSQTSPHSARCGVWATSSSMASESGAGCDGRFCLWRNGGSSEAGVGARYRDPTVMRPSPSCSLRKGCWSGR